MVSNPNSLKVGILIFDDVEVLDFCGPFEVFTVAGFLASQNQADFSGDVFTIAQTDRIIKARGNLQVKPDYTIENHPPVDLLIVPGGWGTRREVENEVLLTWLAKVSQATQLNASVCTGSFLLGKIGLLDGKQATTHWGSLDRMAQTFPQVQVKREIRWVDEGAVITSAGISAGIDMSLHLVERIYGRELAEKTAHHMEYFWQQTA